MLSILGRKEWNGMRFQQITQNVCSLELINCLFLDISIYYFQTTVGYP